MLRRDFVETITAAALAHRSAQMRPAVATLPSLGLCVHLEEIDEWAASTLGNLPGLAIRGDIFWSHSEVTRSHYAFDETEGVIRVLSPFHFSILAILDYGNPLYSRGNAPVDSAARRAFADFAAAAVSRFRASVGWWQIYNEPNLPQMWRGPKPDPTAYAELYDSAYISIKRAAPETKVIPAGMGGADWRFWAQASERARTGPWPVCALHAYRRTDPETIIGDVQQAAGSMTPAPRVWITEWGYSRLWRPDLTEESVSALLHRSYWGAAVAGAEAVFWYHFGTKNPQVPATGLGFELVDPEKHRTRRAWDAFVDLYRRSKSATRIVGRVDGDQWTRLTIDNSGTGEHFFVTLARQSAKITDIPRESILIRWGDLQSGDADVMVPSTSGGAVIYHRA